MSVPQITPRELSKKLSLAEPQRPVLLDVRTPEEHQLAALAGSVLIPLQELQERLDELALYKGREVVVYCHLGMRSLSGASFLRDQGFDASSLGGGIDAWSEAIDPKVPRY